MSRVHHENYILKADVVEKPTTYEEAMLLQNSDIDELLTKLTRKMAECELLDHKGNLGQTIGGIFLQRLKVAMARQNQRGHKARWRRVRFTPSQAG